MAANWDSMQTLNNGRVEWPTGPITGLNPSEEPRWVEAWVVQADAGAVFPFEGIKYVGSSQSSGHTPHWSGWGAGPYTMWKADDPGWAYGNFTSGFALGIALLAYRDTATNPNTTEFEWWYEIVWLA
jgi:hypothetical protein